MNRFGKVNNIKSNDFMSYISSYWWFGLIIAAAIVAIVYFTIGTKSGFSNFLSSGSSLKDLDVVMFMSPECPWCVKTIAMLEKEGKKGDLKIVDITTDDGAAFAKQFGADKQPIPSFISKKLKSGSVGYRENVSELVNALTTVGNSKESGDGGGGGEIASQVQQLQIYLFTRDGCPWCTKAKDSASNAGVLELINVVDITTPEGAEMASQMLPPGSKSVPAFVSMATKKHLIGFKPIEEVLEQLK